MAKNKIKYISTTATNFEMVKRFGLGAVVTWLLLNQRNVRSGDQVTKISHRN